MTYDYINDMCGDLAVCHDDALVCPHGGFVECDTDELISQIARMTLLAISGGRVIRRDTGITLPVGAGYSVTIDLDADDTYVVRRVFKRGDKVFNKGERREVYCDEVSEVAYYASSFRSHETF